MSAIKPCVLVHGGVGSPESWSDGCRKAAQAGMAALRAGKGALEAAVAAVRVMEDDGRFNAGSGSVLRIDGKTIEMDAAVMDSSGTLGAVAVVTDVKNPILLAREVARTPHVLLAGEGATALARRLVLPGHPGPTARAVERHQALAKDLCDGKLESGNGPWKEGALDRLWNFEGQPEIPESTLDTVGAVVLDEKGEFAVASSTGGSSPMLRGRVGDVPLIGCGFYAGAQGSVAATGLGEEIVRRLGSLAVYRLMEQGISAENACKQTLQLFPENISAGFIAIDGRGYGVAANREMAWCVID